MKGTGTVRYQVIAVRERGRWVARIGHLPHVLSRAHTLRRLDAYVRDVIGLALGCPATASRDLAVDYDFRTGDATLDRLVRAARAARRSALAEQERARRLTEQALAVPGVRLLSRRDLALMLDISHQRVQQITTGRPTAGPGRAGRLPAEVTGCGRM